jgi:hypothetical protein
MESTTVGVVKETMPDAKQGLATILAALKTLVA